MIYSGADLIRTSGQQQDKVTRLKVVPDVKPAEQPAKAKSSLDGETQSALERFARFLNKKKPSQNKTSAPKSHPYASTLKALELHYDRGQRLDIYV